MKLKIAHIADLHIRKNPSRNEEYRSVFENLFSSLKSQKPDTVMVLGDLVHDYNKLEGEQLILAAWFLTELAKIAPVFITEGNHDQNKNSKERINSVEAIVKTLNNPRITHLDTTGEFAYNNDVSFVVWKHGDDANPWDSINKENDKVYIDLFHDPVEGSKSALGHTVEAKRCIRDFKGDVSMFGDIHLYQTFGSAKNKTKAYCGSLIQQNFGEAKEGHGYILWEIVKDNENAAINITHELIEIHNDWSHETLVLHSLNDLENIEIPNVGKYPNIRVLWYGDRNELTNSIKKQIRTYCKNKFNAVNVLIEREKKKIILTETHETVNEVESVNIRTKTFQDEMLKSYLSDIDFNQEEIESVFKLDEIINKRLNKNDDLDAVNEIELHELVLNNFLSYGSNVVLNFDDLKGVIAISAKNGTGKSTLISAILFCLYGKTLHTNRDKQKIFNNKNSATELSVEIKLSINGENYILNRNVKRKKGKEDWTYGPVNFSIHHCDSDWNAIKNENETQQKETTKLFENKIGGYDDFIRNNILTGDIINQYLSTTPSIFLDALLRDMGLNIYEEKHEEYKKYKKDLDSKVGKIVINREEEKIKLEELQELVKENNDKLTSKEEELKQIDNEIASIMYDIDDQTKLLVKIPDDYTHIDSQIKQLEKEIEDVNLNKINRTQNEISSREKTLGDTSVDANQKDQFFLEREKLETQINSLRNGETAEKEKLLLRSVNELERKTEEEISKLNLSLNNIKNDGVNEKMKKENLEKEITLLNEKIEKLKSNICPECNSPVANPDMTKYETILAEKQELLDSSLKTLEFSRKNYKELADKISEIKTQAEKTLELKRNELNEAEKLHSIEKNRIDTLLIEMKKCDSALQRIEIKKQIEEFKEKLAAFQNLIEEKGKQIVQLRKNIEVYQQQRVNNQIIGVKIEGLFKQKEVLNQKETFVENEKNALVLEGKMSAIKVEEIVALLDRHKKQEQREKIFSGYEKAIHRTGIPSLLLKKSLQQINDELSVILSGLNFQLSINDDFELMMMKDGADSEQFTSQGGGAERTYMALALKLALRSTNFNIKHNMIFMDECFDKLDEDNKELMKQYLHEYTNYIDSIFIIAHDENIINISDHIVKPTRNPDGDETYLIVE